MADEKPEKQPEKQVTGGGDVSFSGAAWLAFGVMVVFVAALLIPDYMNYQLKLVILEQQRPPAAQPMWSLDTNVFGKSSSNVFFVSTNASSRAQTPSEATAVKPSDIYETYAKLITMLLGFISVVGVLFGYFVRRHVRELTEDIRRDVELEMKHIHDQHKLVQDQTKAAQEKSGDILRQVEQLARDYKELDASAKGKLEALDAAIKRYQEQRGPVAGATADVAAKVDDEMQKEGV
jgi:hypothetical protein